ncbi:MAG: hypothetical protein GTO14_09660 [Anaerolineales bacterium]|nr:hypothetical protein [Anaerolineales bacterium]
MALRRIRMSSDDTQDSNAAVLRRRSLLIRINLLFSIIVLALTAIARTA